MKEKVKVTNYCQVNQKLDRRCPWEFEADKTSCSLCFFQLADLQFKYLNHNNFSLEKKKKILGGCIKYIKIIEGSYVDQIQDTNGNNTNFNKIIKTRGCL